MKEKTNVNRYRIAQMVSIETRPLESENYLSELITKIEKYNNNPKNRYYLGNINVDRRRKLITFKKYLKVTESTTLEEIDKFTATLRSDHDLKLLYGTRMTNNHPFVIIYRANKDIRTLPIIYQKHASYLNNSYIKSLLIKHGKTLEFVERLQENKQILSHTRKSLDDYDYLNTLRENIKNESRVEVDLTPLIRFYNAFLYDSKNGKFNYFNFRLFAVLLISYESKKETLTEIEEREEIIGQMPMPEYIRNYLKEIYEELELSLTEGTLDETYKKILIPYHKTTK